MKLNKLTKEQRASIEADELLFEIVETIKNNRNLEFYQVENELFMYNREIKRTIKRIDDEISWIRTLNLDSFPVIFRLRKLKQQKDLYELMEKLE